MSINLLHQCVCRVQCASFSLLLSSSWLLLLLLLLLFAVCCRSNSPNQMQCASASPKRLLATHPHDASLDAVAQQQRSNIKKKVKRKWTVWAFNKGYAGIRRDTVHSFVAINKRTNTKPAEICQSHGNKWTKYENWRHPQPWHPSTFNPCLSVDPGAPADIVQAFGSQFKRAAANTHTQ